MQGRACPFCGGRADGEGTCAACGRPVTLARLTCRACGAFTPAREAACSHCGARQRGEMAYKIALIVTMFVVALALSVGIRALSG